MLEIQAFWQKKAENKKKKDLLFLLFFKFYLGYWNSEIDTQVNFLKIASEAASLRFSYGFLALTLILPWSKPKVGEIPTFS